MSDQGKYTIGYTDLANILATANLNASIEACATYKKTKQ